MAPRRKQRPANVPTPGREFKLRIPEDIAKRIEAKAKREVRPMNRIVINELAEHSDLEKYRDLAETAGRYETLFARYEARIITADLNDDLLRTVHEILKADETGNSGELRARLAKLRVIVSELAKLKAKA
jgi:hypothetical protein